MVLVIACFLVDLLLRTAAYALLSICLLSGPLLLLVYVGGLLPKHCYSISLLSCWDSNVDVDFTVAICFLCEESGGNKEWKLCSVAVNCCICCLCAFTKQLSCSLSGPQCDLLPLLIGSNQGNANQMHFLLHGY
ncbi:hypothetical protein Nepgr_009369 [Nepenthes gracilis]|uniref:Uncharacterized protein n=1 Tax=Nepenthes gracilis TaxID=150966 RepID=A0AAD3XKA0_NEPGR|nr:hypothetical protein Nepgr_009369 [Nepenthes gracilis]